jgi:predicted permease
VQTLLLDLRYALRQLMRNPGFALTACLSLALGMGATTAVFSVVYAALVDPFPYRAVDRIVRLSIRDQAGAIQTVSLNGMQTRQLQQVSVVESVLAMDFQYTMLTGHDLPANVVAVDLIAGCFDDLGMGMVLGRGLKASDAPEGQDPQPVTVLSYKFWQREFLGDPNVLGKTLELNHQPYIIVGVVGPRYTWYGADVYRPLKLMQPSGRMFTIDFRMRPGVTAAAANAALEPLLRQFARDFPKRFPERFQVGVEGLNDWVMRGMSGTLFTLLGAVGLLLAVGCGNVSILLLAKGQARQQELGLRVALGASRGRLVRQLLSESLLLAAVGVVIGVAMSYGILQGMRTILPPHAFAPEVAIRINLPVLVFSGAVALATAILFGIVPALRLSRADLNHIVQSGSRRVAGSLHARRTHNLLIGGQIAITMLLLAGAGTAMEGFTRLLHATLGYDPHNVLSLIIPLHPNSYTTWAARANYVEQLRAQVAQTPGVIVTALTPNGTPPRSGWNMRLEIPGATGAQQPTASVHLADAHYFEALRIRLLEGRLWSAAENASGAPVAVVNRTLARRYFPHGDAIGRSFRLPDYEERPPETISVPKLAEAQLQIVGIVDDVRNDGIENPVRPAAFVPSTLSMGMFTQILVRAAMPPLALVNSLRAKLAAVNPEQQTFGSVEDLDSWISNEPEWQQEHMVAWIFGIFAALALALAAVGLYSVVSYTVAQRTGELGIRMALGAQRGHVLRVVFASTVVSVGSGLAAGIALTLALRTVLGQWVKGDAHDPLVLLAAAAVMIVAAAIACTIPAWRAAAADPMTALRCE